MANLVIENWANGQAVSSTVRTRLLSLSSSSSSSSTIFCYRLYPYCILRMSSACIFLNTSYCPFIFSAVKYSDIPVIFYKTVYISLAQSTVSSSIQNLDQVDLRTLYCSGYQTSSQSLGPGFVSLCRARPCSSILITSSHLLLQLTKQLQDCFLADPLQLMSHSI